MNMGYQLNTLRELASEMLGIEGHQIKQRDGCTQYDKMIEEIFLSHFELEIQNRSLMESQSQLELSNSQYAQLYDFAPLAYFTINPSGLITDVNSAGAELLGIQRNKLINRSLSRYISPESQHIYSNFRQLATKDSEKHQFELKLLKRNGALFYAELTGKLIDAPEINDRKYLIMITDITHHKQPENNIHKHNNIVSYLDRSNATNELVSIITNELNHPLCVISNYIHGCVARLENGSFEISKFLEIMKLTVNQLERTSKIILRMKNFTLKGALDYQLVCINSLIQESISLITQELNEFNVDMSFKKNTSIPNVRIDKLYIQQVILNLARNAIEAMFDHNILDPKLTIEVNEIINNAIEICIIDNGPGFMPEKAYKLFDPYYTTKPYGIGLGLPVSRTIVELHGGSIEANLNLAYGACFKITLPIKA